MAIRLGLDASQRIPSCAVSIDGGITAVLTAEKPIENFSALIKDTVSQAKVSLKEIDEIVVCIGPGSQMGARTAVVTGNALALALGLPVTGVLSADALAVLASERGLQNIAVADGKGRWYVSAYNWDGDKLLRLNSLEFMDELPSNTYPTFKSDSFGSDGTKLCVEGVLIIAKEQKHLIIQSQVSEITPYERGEHNGF